MKQLRGILTGAALAALMAFSPAALAQEGSMQVGNATVSAGGGIAVLTLPDVGSFITRTVNLFPPGTTLEKVKFSEDFDDEIGWNVNGSIAVPMVGANGRRKEISLSGFWANIDDDDTVVCAAAGGAPNQTCQISPLVDVPGVGQSAGFGGPAETISNTSRDVDQWGVALESKWALDPGVMGVTSAPPRRFFALGADIRGIDQDLDVAIRIVQAPGRTFTYDEELDTRYYGAFAAWGGDFPRLFLGNLWERWGLQSTFRLQAGVYYADTDYDGRLVATVPGSDPTSALSLSDNDVAFIGGLTMETSKRIGRRAALSLRSEYEYYSWVPEMAYNTADQGGLAPSNPQVGTVIGDDDAFSMRTSLRLTIGLGPRDLYQEPVAYK